MKLKYSLTIVMMTLFASLTGISAMAEEKKDAAPAGGLLLSSTQVT